MTWNKSDAPQRSPRRGWRVQLGVGLVAILTVGVIAVGAFIASARVRSFIGGKLLYMPLVTTPLESSPARWGIAGTDTLWLRTSLGEPRFAWWLRALAPRRTRAAAIVFYGNKGGLLSVRRTAQGLSARGLDVLLIDYGGYGRSVGVPSEAGLRRDAVTAYSFLREQKGVPASCILLIGHSLGTSLATMIAAQVQTEPPFGLVLVAPYTSLPEATHRRIPWLSLETISSLLPRSDGFQVARSLAAVQSPVTIVVGENDPYVTVAEARLVAAAASTPVTFLSVPGRGHNDVLSAPELWRILDNLAFRLGRPGSRCAAHISAKNRGDDSAPEGI